MRSELLEVQNQLQIQHHDRDLQYQEQDLLVKLAKWRTIEECALKDKSRIQWLKLGDAKTQFFFSAMKARYNSNRILLLYDVQGKRIDKPADVQTEILSFFLQKVAGFQSTITSHG